MDNIPMKSKKKSGKSKSKMPKADDITCWDKKPNTIDNEGNTSIDDTKCSCFLEKMPVKMHFNQDNKIERHKLGYTSHGFLLLFWLTIQFLPKIFRCLTP